MILHRPKATVAVLLFVSLSISGCLGGTGGGADDEALDAAGTTTFSPNAPWMHRVPTVAPVPVEWISVDLPVESLGAAAVGVPPRIHAGVWNPKDANATPAPTVIVFSADHGEGPDAIASEVGRRLGRALIERLTPAGFNVVQVAALGTSFSNHCVDFLGDDDRRSIEAALGWVLEQPWSDGSLYVAGEGYGGAMAWMASDHTAVRGVVALDAPTAAESWLWHHDAPVADAWTRHPADYGPRSVNSRVPSAGGGAYVEGKDVQAACTSLAESVVAGPAHDAPDAALAESGAYLRERNWTQRVANGIQAPALVLHGTGAGNHPPSTAADFARRLASREPVDLLLGAWTPGANPSIEEPESPLHAIGDIVALWLADGRGRGHGLHQWVQGDGGTWTEMQGGSMSAEFPLAGASASASDPTVQVLDLSLDSLAGSAVGGEAVLHYAQEVPRVQVHLRLLDAESGSLLTWGVAASSGTSALHVPIEPGFIPSSFEGKAVLEIRTASPDYMLLPDAAPVSLIDFSTSTLTLTKAGAA